MHKAFVVVLWSGYTILDERMEQKGFGIISQWMRVFVFATALVSLHSRVRILSGDPIRESPTTAQEHMPRPVAQSINPKQRRAAEHVARYHVPLAGYS
jgi:hypothetical protein